MTQARSSGGSRPALRTMAILLIAALVLAGGGWWARQAGLLGQWLAPTAQPALLLADGVQAQANTEQATPETTPGAAGGPPAGFDPSTQAPWQTPGGRPGAAALTATDSITAANPADAAPAAALATATPAPTATTANLVTIPGVSGVKGSRLYDEGGSLLGVMDSGASVLITARSDDGGWLAVGAAGGEGWVQSSELIAYGLQRLPTVALPPAVAIAAKTAAATAITTTLPQPTAEPLPGELTLSSPSVAEVTAATATVTIEDGRLNLRAGPSTDYAIVGKAENGASYTVLGRNAAGDWLQLQLEDDKIGWASAAYLAVAGATGDLPLQIAPAAAVQAAIDAANSSQEAQAVITLVSAEASDSGSGATSVSAAVDGLAGMLVFQQSPGGAIYAYNLDTGDLWPLTDGFDPAISPDGQTVAFVRDGGETGLYLINIDGSNERRIFERAALSGPKWSPDGQWIVFTRNDEGVECYKVSDRMCMLPDEARQRFPMGVPDTMPLVTEYQYKLSTVDRNGGNYHDVAALNSARAADWSDAGIVYQSSAGIQITADAEGATTQAVAFDNLNPYYYDPDLQPGGGQIVFQIKGAAQTDLWVVNTDGGGLHALTQPRTTLVDALPSNVAAAYSPDGQHIVFLSSRTDSGEAGDWGLWVMNADGSDQRPLPVDVSFQYTYGADQVVSWGA